VIAERVVKGPGRLGKFRRLLGRLPDREVARRSGIPAPTVQVYRVALGIPAAPRRSPAWLDRMRALLGRVPDPEIARRTGSSIATVQRTRVSLGIAAHERPLWTPWLREHRRRLGRDGDRVIARRAGVSVATVQRARTALGIPPAARPARSAAFPLDGATRRALSRAAARLPRLQAKLLHLRYLSRRPASLARIAVRLGIQPGKASDLERRALLQALVDATRRGRRRQRQPGMSMRRKRGE